MGGVLRKRPLLAALLLHGLLTALVLASVALAGSDVGRGLRDLLSQYDGGWFRTIATDGYTVHLTPPVYYDLRVERYAFFPGYPMLIRAVRAVFPLGAAWSGILISITAGFVASGGLFVLARRLGGSVRTATVAVALWSVLPLSVVSSMVYSEALFAAFAMWALAEAVRGRWLTAGLLGLAAGAVRPTTLALGVALIVAALALRARPRARALLCAALPLLAVPAWWAFVAHRVGHLDAWFSIQHRYWNSRFDFGGNFIEQSVRAVTFHPDFNSVAAVKPSDRGARPLVFLETLIAAGAALGALVALVRRAAADRRWVAPAAFSVLACGLAIAGGGYYWDLTRFLVPIAPLVLPAAAWLSRLRTPALTLTLFCALVVGAYWSTFMLVAWNTPF